MHGPSSCGLTRKIERYRIKRSHWDSCSAIANDRRAWSRAIVSRSIPLASMHIRCGVIGVNVARTAWPDVVGNALSARRFKGADDLKDAAPGTGAQIDGKHFGLSNNLSAETCPVAKSITWM